MKSARVQPFALSLPLPYQDGPSQTGKAKSRHKNWGGPRDRFSLTPTAVLLFKLSG